MGVICIDSEIVFRLVDDVSRARPLLDEESDILIKLIRQKQSDERQYYKWTEDDDKELRSIGRRMAARERKGEGRKTSLVRSFAVKREITMKAVYCRIRILRTKKPTRKRVG